MQEKGLRLTNNQSDKQDQVEQNENVTDMLIGIIASWSHLCNDLIIWMLDNNIEVVLRLLKQCILIRILLFTGVSLGVQKGSLFKI